jgi:hypothetical protein
LEFLLSPVNILCDGIIILLAFATIKKRSMKYLYMFFAVAFIGVISYFHNYGISLTQFINGMRSIIPLFFSLIFITNILYGKKNVQFYQAMNSYIIAYLVLNIPVSLWQAAAFGIGSDYIGGIAGTWHSGNMSILIYLCTFYVLMQNFDSDKIAKSLLANKWIFLCWIPSFINETKISFILILVFFILCLNISLAKIHKNIIAILLSAAILLVFSYAYQKTNAGGKNLSEILTSGYYAVEFMGTDALEKTDVYDLQYDLQRSIRMIIMLDLLTKDYSTFFFGKSFGHFNISSAEYTQFAKEYSYLVEGSNPFIVVMLLQVGVVGFLIVCLAMFIGISDRKNILPSFDGNHNKMRSFLIAVLIMVSYYSTAFRNFYFPAIFFYFGIWATLPDYIRKELDTAAFTKMRFSILPRRNNAYCIV